MARPTGDRSLGVTVWLTGLPSSGKTTLARAVAAHVSGHRVRAQILDGDELRRGLCADLGFSRSDRESNVRRIGYVAELLARNGVLTLVPVIAPYAAGRAAVRAHHERVGTPFVEVFVDTPLAICVERDVKGLYARQRSGDLVGLTGVDDPYEAPTDPEVQILTAARTIEESVSEILTSVRRSVRGPEPRRA